MKTFTSPRAVQVPVGPGTYDYADGFEIRLEHSDAGSAEAFVRCALEQSPWPVRTTIWLVHRYVIGFRLAPRGDPDHVLGWTLLRSETDVVELEAVSSILRAVLVAERREPTLAVVTTYLFYKRPAAARAIWKVVRPLHQSVARHLLERAAKA